MQIQPTSSTPGVLSLSARLELVDVLERERTRLDAEARRLDAEHSPQLQVLDVVDQAAEYDALAKVVDDAYEAEVRVDDLRGLFDVDRLIVTLATAAGGQDLVGAIAAALVAAWQAGSDVGEVLVLAAAEAQRTVFTATEEWLTSNRPGSWEASYLCNIIESSGWDAA